MKKLTLPEKVVMCTRATSIPAFPLSVKETCNFCGEEVWIGPAMKVEVEQGMVPVCDVCLFEQVPMDTLIEQCRITPTVLKEVSEFFGIPVGEEETKSLLKEYLSRRKNWS